MKLDVFKFSFAAFTLLLFSFIQITLCLYDKDLTFNKDKKFRLVQITDLHYGEPDKDPMSTIITERMLNFTNPDLVAITGDSVSGYKWDKQNTTFYFDLWSQFTAPFATYKTPYAYTTGNHDTEADKNIEEIISLDKTHPFCAKRENNHPRSFFSFLNDNSLTKVSSSNYYIQVYSHESPNKVAAILWFFDSGNKGCEGMSKEMTWGCITAPQIKWYEDTSRLLEEDLGYMPEGFAFYHIPLPEWKDAYNTEVSYGGLRRESVGCPRKQTHFFDSVKKIANIKAMFCGHDHDNDYCVFYGGVELCYGRKTGYGSYGPTGFQRGARVIDLEEKTDESGKVSFTYSQFTVQEDLSIETQDYQKGYHGKTNPVNECDF